jgi:tyrosine-protein phosphatase SIW14
VVGCGASQDGTGSADSQSASTASAAPANFSKVADGIYRGGHPDAAGITYLKSIGIKTIVELELEDFVEATPAAILQEEFDARKESLTLERHPMSAFSAAVTDEFDAHIEEVLATLRDETKRPMFVHCKHGQDRTGLVIGLERVLIEGWTVPVAHDEMVRLGFHIEFLGLEEYFERKTGSVLP